MFIRRVRRYCGIALVLAGVGAALTATAASAGQRHGHRGFWPGSRAALYVAAGSSGFGWGSNCSHAGFSTISAAVAAADPGATIIVCPGRYAEDVTIEKPLTLKGWGATVAPDTSDSSPLSSITGGNNGFTVLSPWVTIEGFTVDGASSDGMVVFGDHATIEHNTLTNNGLGNPNMPGNGINLDGSSYSTVSDNAVSGSGNGGIQLANDPESVGLSTLCSGLGISCVGITGTATYDRVIHNYVSNNALACGILLVDHFGTDGSTADLADGIHDNLVLDNTVANNAMQGYGAGILLATAVPGGAVYNNVVARNDVYGNGLSGLTLHAHLAGMHQDLNGNAIVGNDFGTNNLTGQEPSDLQTTGVFIGSQDHLDIVVKGNVIHDDYYGVFTASPSGVTVYGVGHNAYVHDTVPWFASSSYSG